MLEDILKDAKFYAIDGKTIKPSDVIVISFKQTLPEEAAYRIKELIHDYFPNNKCIVISSGAEILIARVEDDARS